MHRLLSILLLVVGSVFLFAVNGFGSAVNPIVAILGSGSAAAFVWLAVRKSVQAAAVRPSHDPDALIGQVGEARTVISVEGSVQVGGEMWSARSDSKIPAGSPVRVVRREGFILVVEKEKSDKS